MKDDRLLCCESFSFAFQVLHPSGKMAHALPHRWLQPRQDYSVIILKDNEREWIILIESYWSEWTISKHIKWYRILLNHTVLFLLSGWLKFRQQKPVDTVFVFGLPETYSEFSQNILLTLQKRSGFMSNLNNDSWRHKLHPQSWEASEQLWYPVFFWIIFLSYSRFTYLLHTVGFYWLRFGAQTCQSALV